MKDLKIVIQRRIMKNERASFFKFARSERRDSNQTRREIKVRPTKI